MGSPANWTNVENALQAWVKAATGYDNRHAFWANSNVTRPTDSPFAVLEITDRMMDGLAPEVIVSANPASSAGAELEIEARQLMHCAFRVQVYVQPSRGLTPGTPRGASNAAAIASRIRLAAALPSNVSNLDAVGVSIYDMGTVHYVPEITGTDFEGRAVLDASFYVVDSASEFTGYIETVGVSDPFDGGFTIDIPDP